MIDELAGRRIKDESMQGYILADNADPHVTVLTDHFKRLYSGIIDVIYQADAATFENQFHKGPLMHHDSILEG